MKRKLGPQYPVNCVNEYNSEANVGAIRRFHSVLCKHAEVP